jgi:hypothetical protein
MKKRKPNPEEKRESQSQGTAVTVRCILRELQEQHAWYLKPNIKYKVITH